MWSRFAFRCIHLVRGAAPRCRFSRSRTIFAPELPSLLRSSLVLTRFSRLLSHCFFSPQSWQCSIRCIRLVRGAAPRCRFPRSRTIFAPTELASSDSAFATPVALLLFSPVVAMLHPLHSPLASGANPFALLLGAVEWRFFEAYSPASGFITGKSCTSRMVVESVMSITRRSIPIPMPPVGGRPISSALT